MSKAMRSLSLDLDRRLKESSGEIIALARRLVRQPSENRSPHGDEHMAQMILAEYLQARGIDCDMFTPDEVEGIELFPDFEPGRSYIRRPDLVARVSGRGGGRSLMLSGHIDTVGRGGRAWTDGDPFSGVLRDGRLYGRGSYDMKGALAGFAVVLTTITSLDVRLAGDVLLESAVDEEHCGGNGTVASRVRGYIPDGIMLGEQTDLALYPATRGGRLYDVTLRGESGHSSGPQDASVLRGLGELISLLARFGMGEGPGLRTRWYSDAAPRNRVTLLNVASSLPQESWDFGSLTTVTVRLIALVLPGSREDELDRELCEYLEVGRASSPTLMSLAPPDIQARSRFIPPTSVVSNEPLLEVATRSYRAVQQEEPVIQGGEFCCDAGLNAAFGIPTLVFGPKGGNAHRPDEYVDTDSLVDFARVVGRVVLEWCGPSVAPE